MSCNYADGLSPYEHKGKLGLKEIFDPPEVVKDKVKLLSNWVADAKYVVIHTGAGISTSAGIPDFRGPRGVWTLEAKGEKPHVDISFDEAVPTKTHMAILKLVHSGHVKYVVSQNIDGLHLKSGLPRENLSELHGNMFIEECSTCNRQFVMTKATSSVGQKCLGRRCLSSGRRPCRGKTYDTILDWEAGLPELDLDMAVFHSTVADLNICLGTTLQINPSGNLPLNGKKKCDGRLVICNLQPTKHDKKADLIINTYVDDVMTLLLNMLELKLDEYSPESDPTKHEKLLEWTISDVQFKNMKNKYNQVLKESKKINGSNKRNASSKVKKEDDEDYCKVSKKIKKEFTDSEECKIKKDIKSEPVDSDNVANQDFNCDDSKNSETDSALNNSQQITTCDDQNSGELLNTVNEKVRTDDEIDSGFSEAPDEG